MVKHLGLLDDMTEISFHFNASDKVAHACRLLRKAVNAGSSVVVTGDALALDQLDAALWTFSAVDFIPHCFNDASVFTLAASPVVLGSDTNPAVNFAEKQVLLNLGAQVPNGFERFERLIELVGTGDEDRNVGRNRWKHYASRGYALIQHDMATTAAPQ